MLKLGKGKKRKAVCGYRQYYRFRGNESGHPRHKLYRFSEKADPEMILERENALEGGYIVMDEEFLRGFVRSYEKGELPLLPRSREEGEDGEEELPRLKKILVYVDEYLLEDREHLEYLLGVFEKSEATILFMADTSLEKAERRNATC